MAVKKAKATEVKEKETVAVEVEVEETVVPTEEQEIETVEEEIVEETVEEETEEIEVEIPTEVEEPKVDVEVKPEVTESSRPNGKVKIRMRVDHKCCIAMERYDLKAGKTYTVPENVKRILNKAGLLAPL